MFNQINHTLSQPDGSTVYIQIQNDNYLIDMQSIEGPSAKARYSAEIQVQYPYNSFHSPRQITHKLYGNDEGLFLTKNSKTPFYRWGKEIEGQRRSLNEPIPLNRTLF